MNDIDRIMSFGEQAVDLGDALYTAQRRIRTLEVDIAYAQAANNIALHRAFEAEAERDAARDELDAIRTAMGAYKDSDLVSLATTMRARVAAMDVVETELDAARAEAAEYRSLIDRCRERNKELGAECERLRDALGQIDVIVSAIETDD